MRLKPVNSVSSSYNKFKKVQGYMALLTMGLLKNFNSDNDPLKGIDLDREYELILQKKSILSSNLRRMVLSRFEDKKGKEEQEIETANKD